MSAASGGRPAGEPASGRPARDPARGLRAVGSALLATHAIVVGLSIPVVVTAGGAPAYAIAGLAVIAVLDVVVAGLIGRAEGPAVVAGSVLIAGGVVAGVLSGVLLFLGLLFAGLWVGWLLMRRSYAAALSRRS